MAMRNDPEASNFFAINGTVDWWRGYYWYSISSGSREQLTQKWNLKNVRNDGHNHCCCSLSEWISQICIWSDNDYFGHIFITIKIQKRRFPFSFEEEDFFRDNTASLPKLIAGKGIIIFRRKIPFLDTSRVDRINRITMRVELTTIGHELRIVPCPQEDFQIVQARRSILCSRHDFVEKKT